MSAFVAVILRDVRLAVRQGGGGGMGAAFFLIVVSILPLGLGPDLNLLGRIAPGLLWVALLLSVLLSLDRLFQADFDDGTFDLLATGPLPLMGVVVAKMIAHWITTGLPLIIVAPVLGLLLNLDSAAFGPLLLTMLVGTPALNFIGAIGAALTLGVRRGGLLVSLLVMPLYVPVLIFGVSSINAVIMGPAPFLPSFLILTALTLLSAVVAPPAAAAAIRFNLD